MSIRAKFKVTKVDAETYPGQETVYMTAVYGKDGSANAQWSKYTPNGNLNMTISNPDAQCKLVAGKEYFLDFTEAPEES